MNTYVMGPWPFKILLFQLGDRLQMSESDVYRQKSVPALKVYISCICSRDIFDLYFHNITGLVVMIGLVIEIDLHDTVNVGSVIG